MPNACPICDGFGLAWIRQFNKRHGYWYFGTARCTCGSPAGEGDFYDEPKTNKDRMLKRGVRYWNADIPMLQPHEVAEAFSDRRRAQFEMDEYAAAEERRAMQEESHAHE